MKQGYVALLRGVNVGGKNKLPMKELAALFEAAGCANVRWYIQSGNVLFEATPKLAARIPEQIQAAIGNRFGFSSPVIVRPAERMRGVVANNPFLAGGSPEDILHVVFLANLPAQDQIDGLDKSRSAPDEFACHGQEIYLSLPNGAARTKLTNAYFDSRLATVSTMRNWRTVHKLVELM